MLLLMTAVIFCLMSWVHATWAKGKAVAGTRKLRLMFFGISLASFIFAFYDIILYLGRGIPFISLLLSFAIGGFFTVLERMIELFENKDI
jgi:hypothetical protein